MKNELNVTGDTADVLLATVHRRRESQSYAASVFVQGSFGSGTATLQVSPDGGTTKYTIVDAAGEDAVFSANGYTNFVLGGGSENIGEAPQIYVNLAGASGANLNVILFDNR